MRKPDIVDRVVLGWGKLRRFYLHALNRAYVRRNRARRKGECRRCGACCALMFKCPFLDTSGPVTSCVCHDDRWENCRVFPVDERDLADRDRISSDGPCGYRFDPQMRPQRWLSVLVAAGLALAAGAEATQYAGASGSDVIESSFGRGRLPRGWVVETGSWETASGGILARGEASMKGVLRMDGLVPAGSGLSVDVWVTFPGGGGSPAPPVPTPLAGKPGGAPEDTQASAEALIAFLATRSDRPATASAGGSGPAGGAPGSPELRLEWGGLSVRVVPSGRMTLVLGGWPVSSSAGRALSGRFRLSVEYRDGLVTARVDGGEPMVLRDLYRRVESVAEPAIRLVGRECVVNAARTVLLPPVPRPKTLREADALSAALDGDRIMKAARLYALATSDPSLAPSARAEAALKCALGPVGWLVKDTAARSFDLTQRLDPEGPWGERARLGLARASLDGGDPATALGFLLATARSRGRALEEGGALMGLASRAREELVRKGEGFLATTPLKEIAEHLEWSGAGRETVRRAWEEVALSLDGRGLALDAAGARRRAR